MKNLIYLGGVVAIGLVLAAAGCARPPVADVNLKVPAPGFEDVVDETVVVDDDAKPSAETVVIRYTGSAFSPNSITISVGDTVRFENVGQTAAMWPAAAPHPSHTSVPGFDALRPLDTGGEYEFTFTKAGTVRYHNHLNPVQTGTIIVR